MEILRVQIDRPIVFASAGFKFISTGIQRRNSTQRNKLPCLSYSQIETTASNMQHASDERMLAYYVQLGTDARKLCTRFQLGNGQGIWASTNKRARPGRSGLSPTVTYSSRHKTGTHTLVNATTTWKQPVRCSYRCVRYADVPIRSVCELRHNDTRHLQADSIDCRFCCSKTLTILCRCLVYIDSRSLGSNKSVQHISLLPRLCIRCLLPGGTLLPYLACSQQT